MMSDGQSSEVERSEDTSSIIVYIDVFLTLNAGMYSTVICVVVCHYVTFYFTFTILD